MSWKEAVAICKDAGIWTIVDASSFKVATVTNGSMQNEAAPSSEIMLTIFPDLCFLWGSRLDQPHQVVPMYGSIDFIGDATSFNNLYLSSDIGTFDYTHHFSFHVALQWREWTGGEAAIQTYCNNLAKEGGKFSA
ncbi:hypothetical protein BT96DRAFT_1026781 [Gymnopus androsaceus JB14]|uniref:Uncharacterized protein n=1 Tax=Gymnopus androsaceus JB14 TaxID=1447944 RepID=A0A6A4GHK6_9AGAR|nr:hypothetical protein BT96DRAFT_1026781 [Gymnopus androsaceus JB14]